MGGSSPPGPRSLATVSDRCPDDVSVTPNPLPQSLTRGLPLVRDGRIRWFAWSRRPPQSGGTECRCTPSNPAAPPPSVHPSSSDASICIPPQTNPRSVQLQRENFADFVQAFFDTDRVLLVDMMVKFLVTPAGQPVTLDRWEEWVVDPAHQRLVLVHYCKELSDDSDSSTSAAPSACSEHTTSNKVLTKMRRCCPFGLPRAPSAPAPPPAPHGPS